MRRVTRMTRKKAPATACERFSNQSVRRRGARRRCVLGAATRKPPPPLFLPGVVTLITQDTGTPERPKAPGHHPQRYRSPNARRRSRNFAVMPHLRLHAVRSQLPQPLHGHRHGRVVERLLLGHIAQHRQGETQAGVIACQPVGHLVLGTGAGHRQHLTGQRALVRGQLVTQHATCHRVPTAVDLQRVDLLEQPRQTQRFAKTEMHLGDFHRRACACAPVR